MSLARERIHSSARHDRDARHGPNGPVAGHPARLGGARDRSSSSSAICRSPRSPPLAILVGGFESINALHVGVERIGRYLQVFYEGMPAPAWETTTMAAASRLRGGGVDPLFTVVFSAARSST